MTDSTERFSDRVDDYVRYRPGYPAELIDALLAAAGESSHPKIADIGSGTGIFTHLLLERGARVSGVEPNAEMRRAAETTLRSFPGFNSIDGSAEETGLAARTVDLVTAAQAFHWFNNSGARREFVRILKPGGMLALVWNRRRLEEPFQQAYDSLLRAHSADYEKVNHLSLTDASIGAFFAPAKVTAANFDNPQILDFDGLLGRLRSASYCPPTGTPTYRALVADLEQLFADHAVHGKIRFVYDSRLYLGPRPG